MSSGGDCPGPDDEAKSVMVVAFLHLDLGNGAARTVYWFIARRFANVIDNLRKFSIKRGAGQA
jgi:hypothetical protein